MTDVNVTEKVARAILATEWEDPRGIHPPMRHETQSHYAYWCPLCRPDLDDNAERIARTALAALSDPEVLAGMAGVLREHSESRGDASFLPSCRCGWVGPSRMAWVADLARHQATALADWLRGQES